MACKGFDEQLVRHDPLVKDLMDQFVGVRMVKANALDLTLFQFDFDLTFAAFFMNADRTIYGRFGTRSDNKEATRDISIEGFREAMLSALALHQQYPANQVGLAGKRGSSPRFRTPEDYPSLTGKYLPDLDYGGQLVRSCMHCHMIGEAERLTYRTASKPMPDEVLYPWPMPDLVGVSLDPKQKARVVQVTPGTPAARAGLERGDDILSLDGQPMISIADVQWVLHRASLPAKLEAVVVRAGRELNLTLALEKDWRRRGDISWRATSWDLRRMATGGLLLEELTAEEKSESKLADAKLALRVKHVGQYGEHATAKKAGFEKDDVIVSWDGKEGEQTESELLAYMLKERMPGSVVPVTVMRGGQRVDLKLPVK